MSIYWKSHGKRPLGGMTVVGETYGSSVDTKPIKSKNGQKLKQTFFQRRHTEGQKAHGKMLN